jgi:hypothetical protein
MRIGRRTDTRPADDRAFYTDLQGEIDGFLDRLSRLLTNAKPKVERDLTRVRGLHAEMRALLDRVDYQVERLEAISAAIDELVDPGSEVHLAEGLRGRAIADAAIDALRASGRADAPIHYLDWFRLFEQAGARAAGANPIASFSTAIGRHPDIERVSRGIYRLRSDT